MLCAWMVAASACMGMTPVEESYRVDSLNRVAYDCRYRDLNRSAQAAEEACREAGRYRKGKAEACNNLAFCAFMRMDFEEAERLYRKAGTLTQNELERLIADVGLMKIYQRTAMNKEFYEARNDALLRMKRIDEERELFTGRRERRRLLYARSEYSIVSAIYHYYLQQQKEALAAMDLLPGREELAADTAQWLYSCYIRGAAGLCMGETADERRLREFDNLFFTWRMASDRQLLYFEGNGLQGMAHLLMTPDVHRLLMEQRRAALFSLDVSVDSLLPLRLAHMALEKFRQYDDLYQTAGAYVTIGRYLNLHGRYQEALDTLTQALECVNEHHRRFYHCHDTLDRLKPFGRIDTLSVEKRWMQQKLKSVPEWISRIREQMCVAYSGLGEKAHSDYNRNIYLDILEDTRQDKEWESRSLALEAESRQLTLLLLAVLAACMLVGVALCKFNAYSKEKNRAHLHRLQQLLDICQKIIASVPADAQTEEEVENAIAASLLPDMERMLGVAAIHPYLQWAIENGRTSLSLTEERRCIDKQRYIHELHIAENKRQNVEKKACIAIVNGICPYIDRILNEVKKLGNVTGTCSEEQKAGRYQYIEELVDAINEYNDILSLWIKMRQGILTLNVETFALEELFVLLRKSSRTFEMRQIAYEVMPTESYVKADKALTLFMVSTLTDNARKYTAGGGWVKVYASETENYVEISVQDNGRGLSAGDVERILGSKVYDSRTIGMDSVADGQEWMQHKGSGFGLMNCKGIIEKYRKTNPVFSVCQFGIESKLGQGSRFFFRLPKGVKKLLLHVCLLLSVAMGACQHADMPAGTSEYGFDDLLDVASDYANEAYYCNVEGHYRLALDYVDSAMVALNAHHDKYNAGMGTSMVLAGEGSAAELEWWNQMAVSDYHVILDIRNEAAVAFLALKQWDEYHYNNVAYSTLYKLLGEDRSIEAYCRALERSTGNKLVGVWLLCILFAALPVGYYFLYLRRRLVERWNLEQILEIYRKVSAASQTVVSDATDPLQREDDLLRIIPYQMVNGAYAAVNELMGISRLSMSVYGETVRQMEYATCCQESDEADEAWKEMMDESFGKREMLCRGSEVAMPLLVDVGHESRCMGTLYLKRKEEGALQKGDRLLLELIVRYVSIVVFNAVVKLMDQYRNIENAQDEMRRASGEESQLHVQNMILDNCLSTIKHETSYYPNKIKQLVGRLRSKEMTAGEEQEYIRSIDELIEYYKGIFTLLSRCASRQLEEVTFRRTAIAVPSLVEAAEKYFLKVRKQTTATLELIAEPTDDVIVGDENLLQFLLENLIDDALSVACDGILQLNCAREGDFVRFQFIDRRRELSRGELDMLFSPDLSRMESADAGRLKGIEFLLCKQIVREHDEFTGRRGCRIFAEPAVGGGFEVVVTIPVKKSGKNE